MLINTVMFSNGVIGEEHTKYLDVLDVPVIQAILNPDSYKIWRKENYVLTPSGVSINVAMPEFDGGIITVPIANKETKINKDTGIPVVKYVPCTERIEKIINIARNHAFLRNISNHDKKIAIILHNYPPKNETIGCAYGLDTQQSVINVLKALKENGVKVERIYENSKELMDEILSLATNHEQHGSLEWLPGKAVALSITCNSDCAIDDLPNIYPYIINNPGEGTQAKRRSYACIIDHLEPAMENADIYDELASLENKIDEYYEAKTYQSDKCEIIQEEIESYIVKCGLNIDLKIDGLDFEMKLELVHAYLNEMKDTLISNGLHILGECPQDESLVKFLVALTRLSNHNVSSLRESIAKSFGYSLDDLYNSLGKIIADNKTGGHIIENINNMSIELVRFALENDDIAIQKYIKQEFKLNEQEILDVITYIKHNLLNKIYRTDEELKNLINAVNGKFVAPGPSGAPTRGQADILPTGRNFYTVNPYSIPTEFAWKTGKDLGDELINRYINDNGKYPESVGIILFGSPTMRTKGDDVAEILYLLGVKPVWQGGSGNVKSFEVIPLKELGRPRIDVTVRASGFFRDAFANIMELIDEAVQTVSNLDESYDMNFIKKHVDEDIKELREKGLSYEKAKEKSTYRVFSAKPGAYGTGVNTLIDEKNWTTNEDIANVYLEWGSYAYSKKTYGQCDKDIFKRRLSKLDVAVKNIDTKETDILANDDNYAYLGGMIAATTEYKGQKIDGIIGDSSDPVRVKVRNVQEEAKFVIRTKVLNPKWYKGLQRHGYKGAMDISRVIDYVFGWDATSDVIDDWTYEQLTEKFVNDEDFSEWMKENNPWALQNIIERMLEAIQRGMWKADEKTLEKLTNKYLENESVLEGDN